MPHILIVGAKSDIAMAVARVYATNGYDLYLAARKVSDLDTFARSITISTQRSVKMIEFDILDVENHASFYEQLDEKPQGVISAVGYLGNQEKAEVDCKEAKLIMETNYIGVVSLFNIIAEDFERRRNGFIIGISSVAGDRGRKGNYLYGSAKAALSAYLSGLRHRLYISRVHVLTVKPGFVATRMIVGLELPKILTTKPEKVAEDIYHAQQRNKNILYTKRVWRVIMLTIQVIPEWIFKRMNI
jgi:short-subunit dehydrogenase